MGSSAALNRAQGANLSPRKKKLKGSDFAKAPHHLLLAKRSRPRNGIQHSIITPIPVNFESGLHKLVSAAFLH